MAALCRVGWPLALTDKWVEEVQLRLTRKRTGGRLKRGHREMIASREGVRSCRCVRETSSTLRSMKRYPLRCTKVWFLDLDREERAESNPCSPSSSNSALA